MDKGGGVGWPMWIIKGGVGMRVDEGRCYKMWIGISYCILGLFKESLPITKKK